MSTSIAPASRLVANQPFDVAGRFTESAFALDDAVTTTEQFFAWYGQQGRDNSYGVDHVPLDDLDGWHFEDGTGDLVHRSGRFFRVQGVDVTSELGIVDQWSQPIINQPEVGVLGILVKEFDGVLHCLMQAKMEPGNANLLQLSPTVQATRSNYMRVHGGASIPYLSYFQAPREHPVLVDSLQSEQGSWFLGKRNRNMVVEATDEVEVRDGFCWLTMGQLHELLSMPNLVNMDSRTVMSCIPFSTPAHLRRHAHVDRSFRAACARSLAPETGAWRTDAEVISWFVEEKVRRALQARPVGLGDVEGWHCDGEAVRHDDGRFFEVVGVDVDASNREVARWSQPLLRPVAEGLSAFIVTEIDGVLHVMAQARAEAGTCDVVELGPTLQCTPSDPQSEQLPFAQEIMGAAAHQVRYDVVHSEEGGRFDHATTRYMVVEMEDLPLDPLPLGYEWITLDQLTRFVAHSNYVNVQARTLLTCLHTLW